MGNRMHHLCYSIGYCRILTDKLYKQGIEAEEFPAVSASIGRKYETKKQRNHFKMYLFRRATCNELSNNIVSYYLTNETNSIDSMMSNQFVSVTDHHPH